MTIEHELKLIVKDAVNRIIRADGLEIEVSDPIIERPKIEKHGDYSTNIAMVMATAFNMSPRDLACRIMDEVKNLESPIIIKVDVAGPGFINIFLSKSRYFTVLDKIYSKKDNYGVVPKGSKGKVLVEFVSANPTGPLHVGHGRGAVYGDTLASVFSAAGYDVTKEYYLNDAGNQIYTLGKSVYLRLKEINGERIDFPSECYQGHYIVEIARELNSSEIKKDVIKSSENKAVDICGRYASEKILSEIKDDLSACGIEFDTYFSERSLHQVGEIDETMKLIDESGFMYEKDGAIWFKSTEFGDAKDRVLKKTDGKYTYFAADISYHRNKFERGFDTLIDVWGADHGGHVKRMHAAMDALGYDSKRLSLVLIQLVNLIRGGKMVSMSTRAATYETFRSLINDIGKDVCRYFFLMRSHNAQLDFDLELARKQSPENPVYYIQYAYARICSVFRKAEENGIKFDPKKRNFSFLKLDDESRLAKFLSEYPKVIRDAANSQEPHKLSFYLLELARFFQSYYSAAKNDDRYKVIEGEEDRIQSKLYLLKNIQIVLKNGLEILGITAPERMVKGDT